MQEMGLPYNDDFNDGDQYGVGTMQYTIVNGKRCDVYSSFLQSKTNNKNLHIKTNSIVTKVIVDQKKLSA